MKVKKWLLGLVTFAAMAVLCAVCAGAENYHAYIGFQTGAYSLRNSFDDATFGKDVADGKYFNSVIVWGGNNPETFPQYEDKFDDNMPDGGAGYVLPATYTDVQIDKDGTYKVGISDFDWALDGASSFNLLFVSTDIPFDKDAGEDGESIAKFSDCKIIVDGKVTSEVADPIIDTVEGEKSGNTKVLFANVWINDLESYAGVYPTKSLEIQFDVSFTQNTNFEYYENSDGDTVSITKYIGSESDVVIPEEIDGKSVTAISYGAFSECTDIKSVVIPNSVTSIDSDAFYGCTSLTSITIPNSVTEIGWGTFGKCTSLTSITIPNSVTSIGNGAFANCTSLTTINVATGNKNYISVNGVLYNKDKTTIICYPAGKKDKNFKIPDGVTEIADSAFDCCASLTSITIPDSVTVIDDSAFSGCTSLTSIAIPNSVTHIGDGKITKNSTTTYRASGLKASTVYKFRVRAYKMSGKTALYGNYSATVAARTNPSVVKGVKIAGKAKDALRINWTKNASAQGYIVEMYKGGKWVRVAKITNNSTTTFRKSGLAKNTTYKFRVKAYYMSGKTALYGNYGSVSGKTSAK